MTLSRRTLLALGGGAMLATGAVAQSPLAILARFPNGTFLENLVVEPGGRVIFTNYFAKRLESWSPAGGHVPWAEVPAHPVSLTALDGGRHALAVHGVSFMDGPQAMRGQAALLVLAADGTVARRIALPEAVFPNGGLLLGGERLLLADSIVGRIWLVDLGTGEATTWLAHSSLAPDPAQPYPGANGMKRAGDWLLVSNSATRQLLRVRLAGSQPQGAPELLARMTGGVDDFAVARDGTIYATRTGDFGPTGNPATWQVLRVALDGAVTVFAEGAPLRSPNGVALDPQGNVVVANSGDSAVVTFSPNGRVLRTEAAAQAGSDGLVIMPDGTKYVSSVSQGGVSRIRPGRPAELIARNIPSAASMCYDAGANQLVIPMNEQNGLAFVKLR